MKALLFLLFCIGVVGLIVWLLRKNRQLTEQRNLQFSVQARHAGWRFAPNPQYSNVTVDSPIRQARSDDLDIEFEIQGPGDGPAWRMWYDVGRRSDADRPTPYAVWLSDEHRAPELAVMILPRWQYRIESGRVVGAIESAIGTFVSAVSGTDGHDTHRIRGHFGSSSDGWARRSHHGWRQAPRRGRADPLARPQAATSGRAQPSTSSRQGRRTPAPRRCAPL